MSDSDEIRDIKQRMVEIRGGLDQEVGAIRHHAKRLVDWRFYVKSYPIASVAVAGLVGYLAIPKRPKIVQADEKALAAWAKKNKLIVQSDNSASAKKGMAATAASIATAYLLSAGKAYLSQQARQMLMAQMQKRSRPTTDPSPVRKQSNGKSPV